MSQQNTQNFMPMKWHEKTGRNIKLSKDNCEAKRTLFGCYHGYIFSTDQLSLEQDYSLRIRIDTNITKYSILNINRLTFGLTACNPTHIKQSKLPFNIDLLNRQIELWTFFNLYKYFPEPKMPSAITIAPSSSSNALSSVPSPPSSSSSSGLSESNNINNDNNNNPIVYEYHFHVTKTGDLYVSDNSNKINKKYILNVPVFRYKRLWIFLDISDPQQRISLGKQNKSLNVAVQRTFGFLADSLPSTSSPSSSSYNSPSSTSNGYSSNTQNDDMKEYCCICNKFVVKIISIDELNVCYDCYQQQDNTVKRFRIRNLNLNRRSSEPINNVSAIDSFSQLQFDQRTSNLLMLTSDTTNQLMQPIQYNSNKPSTIEADKLCIICLDAEKTHAILPCGHYSFCETCCTTITDKCPICNVDKIGTLKIYF